MWFSFIVNDEYSFNWIEIVLGVTKVFNGCKIYQVMFKTWKNTFKLIEAKQWKLIMVNVVFK